MSDNQGHNAARGIYRTESSRTVPADWAKSPAFGVDGYLDAPQRNVSQAQRDAARAQASPVKSTPASESTQRHQAAAPVPGLSR